MFNKIIFLTLLSLYGCASNADATKPSKTVSDFYRTYVSTSEQIKQFKSYGLEDQYEIFIFGNQVVHPPATYLASPFAKQGSIIVPFLKEKLESAQNEVTVRDITSVFSDMARLKLYNFSNDTELMGLLERRANGMRGIWKQIVRDMVSEIQSVH